MRKLKYLSAALLTAIALTACEDDLAVINPDPGQPSTAPDETAESTGRLSLASDPATKYSIMSFHKVGSEKLYVELNSPATEDITYTISIVDAPIEYNTISLKQYFHNIYPITIANNATEYATIDNNIVTIPKGALKSSEAVFKIDVSDKFYNGSNAIFLEAKGTDDSKYNLVILAYQDTDPKADISKKGCTIFSYIDTEVVNPLIANYINFNLESYTDAYESFNNMPLVDVVNLRKAQLKFNNSSGNVEVRCTADQLYVLKHYREMIQPLQSASKKVCLTIEGGGDGYGFANIPEDQIYDVALQIKTLIDAYNLDGINLRDENVNYGKPETPEINPTSYPKIIKTLRQLMPDKLITIADDGGTVSLMSTPVDGIIVGELIDYVLNVKFNTVNNPWNDSERKPIAGLTKDKYAVIAIKFAPLSVEEQMEFEENTLFELMDLTLGEGMNTLGVIDNIPYYDYNQEMILDNVIMYLTVPIYGLDDAMALTNVNEIYTSYYAFKKDW